MIKKPARGYQHFALFFAILIAVLIIYYSSISTGAWFHSSGKLNYGHEGLRCKYCHQKSEGSFRQQVQANLQFYLGNRESKTKIGHKNVDNTACLQCHHYSKDKHPVYRFLEPRFSKARVELKPQFCVSCHMEHKGVRITTKIDYCKTCHKNLKLKKDPLDVPHEHLIKLKQWNSCLGCHDFHGNHKNKIPKQIDERYSEQQIVQYFAGELQLYSEEKKYKAKRKLDEQSVQ